MAQTPQFSGAVRLGNLNDYIAPAQSCVVALSGGKLQLKEETLQEKAVRPRMAGPALSHAGQPDAAVRFEPVKHQSGEEFLAKLAEPGMTVVMSIAPQSRAALAAFYGLPPSEAFQRLTGWLHGLGVCYVLDASGGRDMALLEAAAEFVERYRSTQQCSTSGQRGDACAMDVDTPAPPQDRGHGCEAPDGMHLPMLASACPGWVMYAEKTHGDTILPHISSTRSPQAVMGSLVKRFLCPGWGVDPARCYHISVMPCYDKKLEAVREELCIPGTSIPETDACLTTSEVQQLLQQAGVSHLQDVPPAPLDPLLPGITSRGTRQDGQLYGLPGSSGGYAEFILRYAAKELFGRTLPPGPLPFKALRNADMQEVTVAGDNGQPLLRFALAYGFRNIQALMRKAKAGRCEYHYVEVMACPSGCLNGGGQLKPVAGQSPQQLIEQLEILYHQDVIPQQPADSPDVQALYRHWVGGGVSSPAAQQLLHTGYKRREKTVTSAISDW